MKLRKPTISLDWDTNRRVVTSVYGDKFVAFKDRADEIYQANKRVYHKLKKRGR